MRFVNVGVKGKEKKYERARKDQSVMYIFSALSVTRVFRRDGVHPFFFISWYMHKYKCRNKEDGLAVQTWSKMWLKNLSGDEQLKPEIIKKYIQSEI